MTTIIGVDFGGGWADDKTWLTQGHLGQDSRVLTFDDPRMIRRDELFTLLANISTPAVAALDFPFGVPRHFVEYIGIDVQDPQMPDVWRRLSHIHAENLIARRHHFVADHGEHQRSGDQRHRPESYSPLHLVNPVMLGMTYAGIYLLHQWHQDQPQRWHVPPLEMPNQGEHLVTLLETMPGALLKSLGLDYDGYKQGKDWLNRRTHIVDNLPGVSGVDFEVCGDVRKMCLTKSKDDCLDSLIAAVCAAMWAQDRNRFHHPADSEMDDAMLEGWIYVPDARNRAGRTVARR